MCVEKEEEPGYIHIRRKSAALATAKTLSYYIVSNRYVTAKPMYQPCMTYLIYNYLMVTFSEYIEFPILSFIT